MLCQLSYEGLREETVADSPGQSGRLPDARLCGVDHVCDGRIGEVDPAVAVELVHNFSLLHDDILDGDTTRRHRATAWAVFGSSAALLAGDALLIHASRVLSDRAAGQVPAQGAGPARRRPWQSRTA